MAVFRFPEIDSNLWPSPSQQTRPVVSSGQQQRPVAIAAVRNCPQGHKQVVLVVAAQIQPSRPQIAAGSRSRRKWSVGSWLLAARRHAGSDSAQLAVRQRRSAGLPADLLILAAVQEQVSRPRTVGMADTATATGGRRTSPPSIFQATASRQSAAILRTSRRKWRRLSVATGAS